MEKVKKMMYKQTENINKKILMETKTRLAAEKPVN